MREGGGCCFGISTKPLELRHVPHEKIRADQIKIPDFRMTHAREWMTHTIISRLDSQGKDTINASMTA